MLGDVAKRDYLGGQLDGNGSALALLDAQGINHGICECFQSTHLQAFFDTTSDK